MREDIIISIWGIGPRYRERVKYNINKAINTGYGGILPYIILTDEPSDFHSLRGKTEKIIDIVNIHEVREEHSPWCLDYEYISKGPSDKYAEEYRKGCELGKHFSYASHRFSLPKISELGYNRFLYCDADTDILYNRIVNKEVREEDFWAQYDTPVNTMKGCDLQTWSTFNPETNWDNGNIILGNVLRFAMVQKYPQYYKENIPFFLKRSHTQTEGPFRYYHLTDPEMVLEYFNLWDDVMKLCLTNNEISNQLRTGGGYIHIDNTPVTTVNDLLGITPLHFTTDWHYVNRFLDDRISFPIPITIEVNNERYDLQPADTLSDFYDINKDIIIHMKAANRWPE